MEASRGSEGGIFGFQDGRSPFEQGDPVCRERYLLQDENTPNSDEDEPFEHDDESKGDFFERVYDELHGLAARQMRSQPAGHTLQATALVSELFLRLGHHELEHWQSRDHFIKMAAATMRSILVDHARRKNRGKRRPTGGRVALDEAAAEYEERSGDLQALDEALVELGENEPDLVSLVELRFFGGCSMQECARLLGKSLRTVQRDWQFAKKWLRKHMAPDLPGTGREAG